MKFAMYTFLVALGTRVISGCETEGRAVTSEEQACEILKHAGLELCLSRTNVSDRYFCDPLPEQEAYYVVGLRYDPTPDELVGSNLIGWFAVKKSDGAVLDWDINEEIQPIPVVSHCPFETQ